MDQHLCICFSFWKHKSSTVHIFFFNFSLAGSRCRWPTIPRWSISQSNSSARTSSTSETTTSKASTKWFSITKNTPFSLTRINIQCHWDIQLSTDLTKPQRMPWSWRGSYRSDVGVILGQTDMLHAVQTQMIFPFRTRFRCPIAASEHPFVPFVTWTC